MPTEPVFIRAWKVPVDGPIEEIQVDVSDDNGLTRVAKQYFNDGFVTLTRIFTAQLPYMIKEKLTVRTTHMTVDDNGYAKNLPVNRRLTIAYGTGDAIVGLGIVYEKELD